MVLGVEIVLEFVVKSTLSPYGLTDLPYGLTGAPYGLTDLPSILRGRPSNIDELSNFMVLSMNRYTAIGFMKS